MGSTVTTKVSELYQPIDFWQLWYSVQEFGLIRSRSAISASGETLLKRFPGERDFCRCSSCNRNQGWAHLPAPAASPPPVLRILPGKDRIDFKNRKSSWKLISNCLCFHQYLIFKIRPWSFPFFSITSLPLPPAVFMLSFQQCYM